jgi:hypothetical protein
MQPSLGLTEPRRRAARRIRITSIKTKARYEPENSAKHAKTATLLRSFSKRPPKKTRIVFFLGSQEPQRIHYLTFLRETVSFRGSQRIEGANHDRQDDVSIQSGLFIFPSHCFLKF